MGKRMNWRRLELDRRQTRPTTRAQRLASRKQREVIKAMAAERNVKPRLAREMTREAASREIDRLKAMTRKPKRKQPT